MKRVVLIVAVALSALGLKAQDCDAIMLPYFKGNVEQMEQYRSAAPEKFATRCAYAQAAFYESDTIPMGAYLHDISEVREAFGTNYLPQNYVVDLSSLSYYAYNFKEFQLQFRECDKIICFSTPSSTHPYLVLRSLVQMLQQSDAVFEGFQRAARAE